MRDGEAIIGCVLIWRGTKGRGDYIRRVGVMKGEGRYGGRNAWQQSIRDKHAERTMWQHKGKY